MKLLAAHEAVLSALEPAAPEPKTLVHEPMVWTGRGPYGMSPAAPDNKTAVGYEPFTLFPDGSYERVQEGFGYRDENGQPQFQQTVPASEQAARRPSGKSPDDYRTDYEIGLDNGYALARPAEQAVTEAARVVIEWYERDGSVGGAVEPFEALKAAMEAGRHD